MFGQHEKKIVLNVIEKIIEFIRELLLQVFVLRLKSINYGQQ